MKKNFLSKLFVLLDKKEKRGLFFLALLMTLNALTEALGVASVAPLIAVITDPNSVEKISALKAVYDYFKFEDTKSFSVFLGGCVLAIVLINNAIALLANYLALRYSNNREASIGRNLLKTYLYQPYLFFLNRHSAELLRNVFNEIAYISSNIISRSLMLFSKGISALAILIMIFIIDPMTTLIIGAILGGAYTIIYLLIKTPLYKMGNDYVSLTEEKLKTITESVKLIKDIKMQSAENMFLHRFDHVASRYSAVRTKSDFLGLAPRYVIEIFAVAALVIAIVYLLLSRENSSDILPLLGVYAFAGFRLIPAMQQVFHSLSKIQFSARSLELISSEVLKYGPVATINCNRTICDIPFKHSFGLKNVNFSYTDNLQTINDVSLYIKKGEYVGFVGKSGEGKSTIIDLLVGLIPPDSGSVFVDDNTLTDELRESLKQHIAYTSQSPYLLDETIDMNITLEPNLGNRDDQNLLLAKKVACVNFMENYTSETLGENGQRLSGGQKQRIGIARAIYQNKPILILDEATSALDSDTEQKILNELSKLGKTTVMISHRVETLRLCDKIFVISEGTVFSCGTYDELEKRCTTFQELLRADDQA